MFSSTVICQQKKKIKKKKEEGKAERRKNGNENKNDMPCCRRRRARGGRGEQRHPSWIGFGTSREGKGGEVVDNLGAIWIPRRHRRKQRRGRHGWGARGCKSQAGSGRGRHRPRSSPVCLRGWGPRPTRFRPPSGSTAKPPWSPVGHLRSSGEGSGHVAGRNRRKEKTPNLRKGPRLIEGAKRCGGVNTEGLFSSTFWGEKISVWGKGFEWENPQNSRGENDQRGGAGRGREGPRSG